MTRTLLASTALMLSLATAAQAVDISFQNGVSPDGSYDGVQSTYLRNSTANQGKNYHSDIYMLVGQTGSDALRTILSFDVSAIPEGATIDSVTLTLRTLQSDVGPPIDIEVYEMVSSFNELTATWNTDGNNYQNPMLTSLTIDPTASTAYYTFSSTSDFVSVVQSAISSGSDSVSLMLKAPSSVETSTDRNLIWFQSTTTPHGDQYTPELSVSYTIPEPATLSLGFGLGVGLLILLRRRARR